MKVHNLTDVPTELLKRYGHVDQQIVVGTELIAPGASAEVGDTPHLRLQMEHFLSIGALAMGELPPSYASAKGKQAKAAIVEKASEVFVENKKPKKDA